MTKPTRIPRKASPAARPCLRLDARDPFWLVTDPGPESTLPDICFEMTLAGLERQFLGGFTIGSGTTLFTDRKAAEAEALARLMRRDSSGSPRT